MSVAWALVLGYAIGSVPFAFIAARIAGIEDLRRVGSGNVGATNLLRATRASTALAAVVLDIAKGALAVLVVRWIGGGVVAEATAGVGAVVGHMHPVWLGFRGGKGVATSLGMFAVLAPAAALAGVVVFVSVVWWCRYVSLGSVAALAATVPAVWLSARHPAPTIAAGVVAVVVIAHHRGNLSRLWAGTEPQLRRRA